MYNILENVDLKVNPVYPGLPILENIYKDFQDFNNIRTLTIVVYKDFWQYSSQTNPMCVS